MLYRPGKHRTRVLQRQRRHCECDRKEASNLPCSLCRIVKWKPGEAITYCKIRIQIPFTCFRRRRNVK